MPRIYQYTQDQILNWLINKSGYTSKTLLKTPQNILFSEYNNQADKKITPFVFGRCMSLLGFTRKSIRLSNGAITKSWQKLEPAQKPCPDCSNCTTCNNTRYI